MPTHSAIALAADWVRDLERVASGWTPPHVSFSPDGDIVFEWWRDPKKLTIYVSDRGVEFVKSWGRAISEMDDGTVGSAEEALSAWKWLIGSSEEPA